MTEVLFYHLERTDAASVLPGLLERSLQRNWRCVVHCADEDEAGALDARLWTFSQDSFLPHGTGPHDARHPVWLTATDEIPDGRDVLFGLVPERFDARAITRLTRAVLMFANDDAPAARDAWKRVKAEGHEATYWKQDEAGRWQKAG